MKKLLSTTALLFIALAFVIGTGADFAVLDGAKPDGVSEWYALARLQYGDDLSAYAAEIETAVESGIPDADKPRTALICRAFAICDGFVSETVKDDSLDTLSAIIWRLVIAEDDEDVRSLKEKLKEKRLNGGGWSTVGETPDVDLTAMALSALAIHGETDDETLEWLSAVQNADGSFTDSFNRLPNAESSAQVVIMLTVCGLDPRTDSRFTKGGRSVVDALYEFRTADGYSHLSGGETNRVSTVQGLLAEAALYAFDNGSHIYSFTKSVTPAKTQPITTEKARLGYKFWAIIAIVGLSAVALCVLLVRKKANSRNLIYLGIVSTVMTIAVLLVNIQTVEQYYSENPDPIDDNSRTVIISVDTGETLLLQATEYALREGETALELTVRAVRYNRLQIDAGGGYIRSIGGLYEFDRGNLSGWTVRINGEIITTGSDEFVLSDGDRVEWVYSDGGAK